MTSGIKNRWHEEGGYREILVLAIPLILSTGSMTIQHFVDRMFLTWYSPEAIAAATPAGLVSFTFMSLFFGTATYVSTFVAQYSGAKHYTRIGPAVWQGIYFSFVAGLVVLPLFPLAPKIFALAGHEPGVRILEIHYFQILIFSGFPVAASSAMAGFFSGRGKTRVIMWVMFTSTAVNIVLDYFLIFGNAGFPKMGIRGAALATVVSQYTRVIIYFYLMVKPEHRRKYWTLKGWKIERELFTRLLRFGFPNGLHYFLDLIGFTLLIMLVGRLGTTALAATNITFNINHLAFMPMMGFGMAVSILVGRRLGACQPELAERSTWSTFHMTAIFMAIIAAAYLFIPKVFLFAYASKADPQEFEPIARLATNLLKFVAVYALFDMMNLIFAAAVKGAGDTRFVMSISVVLSWTLMVIPSYVALTVSHKGLYTVWGFATLYIVILGMVFLLRFQGGKWKTMRVIEGPYHPMEPHPPLIPPAESEISYSDPKETT